jgi:hypothetical protein
MRLGIFVHIANPRREQHIDTLGNQEPLVFLERSGVTGKILCRAELSRVDKNTDDDAVGARASQLHECQVAGMQISHCRNETDTLPLEPPRLELGAKRGYCG